MTTNMSAVSSNKLRKNDPMSRKIPSNPRYMNVKGRTDTGASLTRHMNKIEEIKKHYRYRKDELFKRMKLTTFVQLLIQVWRVDGENAGAGDRPDTSATDTEIDNIQNGSTSSPVPSLVVSEGDFGAAPSTARSTLESVISGVGEVDLDDQVLNRATPPIEDSSPYLLLDVRETDLYEECHFISAISFPVAILSRSVNWESKELLKYRNSPGKIIILYDEDERIIAPKAATTMVERGYDNLFLLSGGLALAAKLFPEGLITGTLPKSITGKTSRTVIPACQKHLNAGDVSVLENSLDCALQDKSIGSRLSQATTASSRQSSLSQMSNSRSAPTPGGRSSTVSTARSGSGELTGRPAFK